MKWVVCFVLATLLTLLAHVRTDGFSPSVCQQVVGEQTESTTHVSWPLRFTYLARGKQAFVFVSEDQKYVLKLFDRTHLQVPWFAKMFGLFKNRKRRGAQRQQIFPESYRLAFDSVREETGLLCVHMGRSSTLWPTIELIDKASRHFHVNLNEVAFVVQKKGEGTLLDKLFEVKNDVPVLKQCLEQYLSLHAKRMHHHIADYDRDIRHNYAWGESGLMYIDPARFFFEPLLHEPARLKHEWWGCTYRLRKWLVKNAPEVLEWYDEKVNQASSATDR